MKKAFFLLLGFVLMLAPWSAHAIISCTSFVQPSAYSLNYIPQGAPSTYATQYQVSYTCRRTTGSEATSITLQVYSAGAAPATRTVGGTTYSLNWGAYSDACTTEFNASTPWTIPMTLSGTTAKTDTRNFWVCLKGAQNPGVGGAFTAASGLALSLVYPEAPPLTNSIWASPGNVPVTFNLATACSITSPPGNITLNYTAFSPQVSQSTGFGVTCNIGYTISVSPASATLLGIPYTVTLNAASGNASAMAQHYTITATTDPTPRAGICGTANCSASQAHTLTVTY